MSSNNPGHGSVVECLKTKVESLNDPMCEQVRNQQLNIHSNFKRHINTLNMALRDSFAPSPSYFLAAVHILCTQTFVIIITI